MSTELTALETLDMAEVQQGVQEHERMLEQMKADYLPLLDTPITDKKRLEVVKSARMNFKNTRLEGVQRLDAGCKALYANWKLWVKARDTFEKKFSDVEELFRAKEKEFEEAQEREFLRIAQEEQRRVAARKERMFQIGFRFDGSKYILEGFAELTENEVSGLGVDDLQLGEWLNDLERQVTEHKERQEEEERTRRIAAEAQAAAQKAEADRIAAAQAELARKQNEMDAREAAMNAKVNEARKNELIAAGMTLDDPDDGLPFGPSLVLVDMCLPVHNLHSMTDEQYAEAIAEAKRQAAELEEYNKQKAEVERLQREQQEKERLAREEAMKIEAAERAVAEERERAQREREAEEEAAARAAQKEVERIASMGDKGLVEQLSAYLVCAPVPDLHTAVGQHGMARVRKHLVDLINMVNSIAKDL